LLASLLRVEVDIVGDMSLEFVIAVAVLIGLALFLLNEVRRPDGPIQWGQRPRWKKRVRIALASLPFIVACFVFFGFFIEPNRLVVHQQTIAIANWPKELSGLRIAVLSDIHVGGAFIDERKFKLIVERTNELQPELIVILGDYMSGEGRSSHRVEPEVFGPSLQGFQAPLGIYSVLGNHDWWYNGEKVRRGLEANGIKVLENEVAKVEKNGCTFWLAGLADLWTRPQRIAQTVDEIPPGEPMLALTHNPDIFPNVPERVPLLLAGHTHGGQVQFPFIGSVVAPSRFGNRFVEGHVYENGHHLFVTTGIGTSIVPVRFAVPPEIVLLTLTTQ
jgi:predicted MPP superfamily phosphohydrolase